MRLWIEVPLISEGYERWDKSSGTNEKLKMEIKPSSPLLPTNHVYFPLYEQTRRLSWKN